MKKKLLFSLLFTFSSLAYAAANDDCRYITGHWRGLFIFNDVEDCERYGNCKHQIEATVTNTVMYNIKLDSDTDVKGVYSVFCNNGKISTPGAMPIPSGRFDFQCYGKNDCHASYKGSRLKLDLYKVAN